MGIVLQGDCPILGLFFRETAPLWDCCVGRLLHSGIVGGWGEVIYIALYCEYISSVFMLGSGDSSVVKRQTLDSKVFGLSRGRSSGRIVFSMVIFLC